MSETLHIGSSHAEDNRRLGALLAVARSVHRFTQTEVARSAGVSRGMLCAIEKGRESPSRDSLTRLLAALGEEFLVTADDAVAWADLTIFCSRFSRYRLAGPPDRLLAPAVTGRSDRGHYIQILDWR
jgi:transcriptional regulator with XRE-family HTH domain